MDAGAMGSAMIFVCLVVLTIFIGFFTFIYAAYFFLVAVQETAAGVDAVRWPNDPLYDKLPRAGYLACLLAIWVAPAGLLLRLNPDFALGGSPFLTVLAAAAVLLWALFPIGLLSALSASMPWIVFRWTVLAFFLRRFGATVVFYFVSALLGAGSLGLLLFTFAHGSILLTFIAPFVVAAAFLIYARLLGRMAYLFDQLPMRPRRGRPAPEGPEATPKGTRKRKARRVEDPWEVPEEEPRPTKPKSRAERMKRYAIAADDAAAPVEDKPQPKRMVKGYRLANEPPPTQPRTLPEDGYIPVGYETVPPSPESSGDVGQSMLADFEQRFRKKPEEENPPPARPLVSGVYAFPWYPENIPVWALLSVGGVAGCGLIQLMLIFRPW